VSLSRCRSHVVMHVPSDPPQPREVFPQDAIASMVMAENTRTLLYQINASVAWKDTDGWLRATHLPIFILNADIQGITGVVHAQGIAKSMLADLVSIGNNGDEPPNIEYHVTVVGITAQI
jgi:hypothetical protein